MSKDERQKRCSMVGWYDPGQLFRTAGEVLVSTLFGKHADYRLLEALAQDSDTIFDYTFHYKEQNQEGGTKDVPDTERPREEIWIDYVADTGDGWHSTYAVAHAVAQPTLKVGEKILPRGDVLVFGGDEVYPTPSRANYIKRLVHPYDAALHCTESPHPHVFAIPGNHDWYDSLVSFTRLFCSKHWFAGWWAPQHRSYFALKLPHGWWLLGTDVQLGSDIDNPQVEYFRKAAKQMQPDDKVILCTAEPHWVYAKIYGRKEVDGKKEDVPSGDGHDGKNACGQPYENTVSVYTENNLKFLEEKVLGSKGRVRVFIAGDLHHYRRHASQEGVQKITAGGGGAFLHPTHGPDVRALKDDFILQKSYPEEKQSARLTWWNLVFLQRNWKFGLLTGALYLLTAWSVQAPIGKLGLHQWYEALCVTVNTALPKQASVLWTLILFFGFVLYADPRSTWFRGIAGVLHGLSHVAAVFCIGWGATYLTVHTWAWPFQSSQQLLMAGLLITAGGWVVGSFLLGLYLLISLNVFRRHGNEAFSSLAIPDYKSFLRMHIDKDGHLTIHPIGLETVPRKWRPSKPEDATPSDWVPCESDKKATKPFLIEQAVPVSPLRRPVMNRLSSPIDQLKDHYEIVVIGSGYGGSIAASRMARAGRTVCLLERGQEILPGHYPDTLSEVADAMQFNTPGGHLGPQTGLYELHVNEDINALVGCGLGGTSLINANVSIEPDPRVWEDPRWPAQIKADVHTLIKDGYKRAKDMLKPVPYPDTAPPLLKYEALRKSAASMNEACAHVPINVTFQEGVNHVGVRQNACVGCGDCVTGCNYAAKNTTLMNYIPDAWNHGAEIFTGVAVRYLERQDNRWLVHYQIAESGREKFDGPTMFITADTVILGAGTLGTAEILLRSKAKGLPLSDRVGYCFSGNGDVLGFGYDCEEPINGIGWGPRPPGTVDPVGPCITGVIDHRHTDDVPQGWIIEEGSIPGALGGLMPEALGLAAEKFGSDTDSGVDDWIREKTRAAESLLRGPYHGAVHNTQTYLGMAHDGADGQLVLEQDRLRIRWPDVGDRPIFKTLNERMRDATKALGGIFVRNPLWSKLFSKSLVTVHPLGGCVMADRAENGAVNHKGQAFAGPSGTQVYEGLYITDGSVIPTSLGVNPLLTISALAERTCALLTQDRGWTISYDLPSMPRQASPPPQMGVRFSESMKGYFSTNVTDDYQRAADRGAQDGSRMAFVVTIMTDDLDALLNDPQHPAHIEGTVTATALSPEPLTVTDGVFHLFVRNPDQVDTHNMIYRMTLKAEDGRTFYFHGYKIVNEQPVTALWPQTSTLYVTVYSGPDEQGAVLGKGILHIEPRDFMTQLTTMEVTNAPGREARLRGMAAFGTFFAGVLYDAYGGVFARQSAFNPEAPPRKKRPLRASPPYVHCFTASDGTPLKLTRYQGGVKGPVMLVHGMGVSSRIFSTDLIETNLVEYLYAHGFDVWLSDFRVSIDLPASGHPFDGDRIARIDHPEAVEQIRKITGAPDIQAVVHCYGANTFMMAMLAGMEGVRSIVCSQVATDLITPLATRLKSGLHVPDFLDALGVDSLTAYVDAHADWKDRLFDDALRLYPVADDEECRSPVCHRITFLYALLYEHRQLDQRIHDNLHELFGVGNIKTFEHLALMVRKKRLVNHAGDDVYLPHIDRLRLPICFIHGAENQCYLPESTKITYDRLRARYGDDLYTRRVIEGYGHIDCIFGKNAARDVYPFILEHLDR